MKKNSIAIIAGFIGITAYSQTLTINISGIRNNKGQILVSVMQNEQEYLDEKPTKLLFFPKTNIVNGKMAVKIDLKPGTYGIALVDDEDKDKNMTYNWIGYPLEGCGFSNFKLKGFSKPKYSDFKFIIDNEDKLVNSEMTYL